MLPVVTSLHDPAALAATCRHLGLDPPAPGTARLGDREVFGWVVRLPGLRYPIVCDTLSGLIAYHPTDNVHDRYRHLMSFVERAYKVRARLARSGRRPSARRHRRRRALRA
jgi:hypothetical protein